MKKLLQINTVVNSGSTGRIAEEIGQTAIAAGWNSYIAFGRNKRPSDSKLIKIGNDWDIKSHGLQTRLFDKHGQASKNATRDLIKQIDSIKPNIIHLHNIHGYYINYEILFQYLNKTDIPVVWTLHDCWSITGHCTYFSFVGCNKWKTECNRCPQKKKYPASILVDRSAKNFNLKKELFTSLSNLTLVPVSNWLGDIMKESFMKNYPIKVINNGINTEIFRPISKNKFRVKHHLENKFILLGVASTWEPRKGLNDFIKLRKLLSPDFKIALVGLTRKQIDNLPEDILGIEITDSVEELAEIYATCDIFVNPTYEDNFPTTNLEALSCGTPVVTYNTGGSPEAIDDSTGIVVEQGDMDGLIKTFNQIKDKGKQFYTDACVSRAHRLYRKEDRYREYTELYESLLK